MAQGDLLTLVERSRKEFVASFAADYNRLVDLAGAAGAGDGAALVALTLAAQRLVGRAGVVQLLPIARHASALETLARVDAVRHFDRGAAAACLGELRDAFVERPRGRFADPPGADQIAAPRGRPLVVVADADAEQRYMMTRVLQRAGFEVVPAATGREAIAIAQARMPAAMLVDIGLADHDGAARSACSGRARPPPPSRCCV